MGRRTVLAAEVLAIVAAVTGCAAAHAVTSGTDTLAPAPEVRTTVHVEPTPSGQSARWRPLRDW